MQKALPGLTNNEQKFPLSGQAAAGQLEQERLQLIEDLKDPDIPF